jgi:hypothetical protein
VLPLRKDVITHDLQVAVEGVPWGIVSWLLRVWLISTHKYHTRMHVIMTSATLAQTSHTITTDLKKFEWMNILESVHEFTLNSWNFRNSGIIVIS